MSESSAVKEVAIVVVFTPPAIMEQEDNAPEITRTTIRTTKAITSTELILEKLQEGSLESKIVKALSLIYILEQFEKLQPSKDEIISIFSISYSSEEINQAIDKLRC